MEYNFFGLAFTECSFGKREVTMNEQGNRQVSTLQRPTTNDLDAWKAYWKAQGWPWRTEPEIDKQRQQYLAKRRSITPNIQQGVYPFKDIKLNRADVEWLLATHDNGRGPVDWNDEEQRRRGGLDLRGANLDHVYLGELPLACLRGGLIWEEWSRATEEQRNMSVLHMTESKLIGTHLEGSILIGAHLEKAEIWNTHLNSGQMNDGHFQGATFWGTNLEGANLCGADLRGDFNGVNLDNASINGSTLEFTRIAGASLAGTTFRGANLKRVQFLISSLEGVEMGGANLENADLSNTSLEGTNMEQADVGKANLTGAFFDKRTKLNDANLAGNDGVGPMIADVNWGEINLAVVDWSKIKMLGDEYQATQKLDMDVKKDEKKRLAEYKTAVRANRQLAVVLGNQGLNEDASRFAYRAQKLQRMVLRRQRKFGQYLFSGFLDLLAGYGYRPGRSVIWYLIIIIGFTLAYYVLGGLSLYPPDAFVFSIMSFHGRGFFPSLSQETNLHNPIVMLAALEAVIGLLIEISFIATFTQRFFGK